MPLLTLDEVIELNRHRLKTVGDLFNSDAPAVRALLDGSSPECASAQDGDRAANVTAMLDGGLSLRCRLAGLDPTSDLPLDVPGIKKRPKPKPKRSTVLGVKNVATIEHYSLESMGHLRGYSVRPSPYLTVRAPMALKLIEKLGDAVVVEMVSYFSGMTDGHESPESDTRFNPAVRATLLKMLRGDGCTRNVNWSEERGELSVFDACYSFDIYLPDAPRANPDAFRSSSSALVASRTAACEAARKAA